MKKIVVFFLIILSVLTYTKNYILTDLNEFNKVERLEQILGTAFTIPDSAIFADPEVVYPLLQKSAIETNVNLFRPSINNKPNNEVEIVKYVLLTRNTDLYNYIHLSSGKPLTSKDMVENKHYLSNLPSKNSNCIGSIKDFGNNNLISVNPLLMAYQHLPVAGTYYVETTDLQVFRQFLSTFSEYINIRFHTSLTFNEFSNKNTALDNSVSSASVSTLTDIQNILILVILLLMVYSVFHQSKIVGTYKLHGISNIRIWFIVAGKVLIITLISSIVIASLACLFTPNSNMEFLFSTVKSILIAYGLVLLASIFPYIYISKIQLQQLIKNRKNTTLILILNTLTKVICSILLLTLANQILHQYIDIKEQQENIKGWEQNKDYGIFYPIYTGYDKDDLLEGSEKFIFTTANELYPILNKMGSLLINTREYEETALILDKDYKGIRSITVNKNYLDQYPIFDANHNQVHISEEESRWVLLVPEKYRNRKSEIMNFFQSNRKSWEEYERNFYKSKIPEYLKKQQIQILWLSNNQRIFSFNPDVFPTEKYSIIDPIIQVVTEKNSFTSNRNGILGNGGTDPLKVKLVGRDTAATYQALLPELRNLRLDDNLKTIVTVNEYMLVKINQLNYEIKLNLLLLGGLMIGFLFLIIQYVLVLYNRYQKTFIVRKLFGLSFRRTYKEFILLFLGLWIAQVGLSLLLIHQYNLPTYLIIGVVAGSEFLISTIALNLLEKRNNTQMSKGGLL
ncbi:DUF1430 domain-containing protein [Paenibacillus zanthoxyli]|uniref:DUF1430 domain-containing protein n=1 Tax=Paenibacillus zanthoxyli TaxID=369399 RepID=UPI000471AFEA|nr:DUF1430 domain-containing protein [Paenibacillus zanthoxyli]